MAARNGLNTLRQIVKHCTSEVKGFENVLDKVSFLFTSIMLPSP